MTSPPYKYHFNSLGDDETTPPKCPLGAWSHLCPGWRASASAGRTGQQGRDSHTSFSSLVNVVIFDVPVRFDKVTDSCPAPLRPVEEQLKPKLKGPVGELPTCVTAIIINAHICKDSPGEDKPLKITPSRCQTWGETRRHTSKSAHPTVAMPLLLQWWQSCVQTSTEMTLWHFTELF